MPGRKPSKTTEFTAFNASATKLFAKWKASNTPQLKGISKDGRPKALIETIAEALLSAFEKAPLLDPYDIYQHLMDYWAETMQDDCYLIAADGWVAGAKVREIQQVKDKNGKLVWAETHDYKRGRQRFRCDLIPGEILIARYFWAEKKALEGIEVELSGVEQELDEQREEHGGEGGLLEDVTDVDGEKRKITAKTIKAWLKENGANPEFEEERMAVRAYARLLDAQEDLKSRVKSALDSLYNQMAAKYPKLTEDEIKTLVVDDKWLATVAAAVQGELNRVSQTLTGRIRQLADRYATPLPQLTGEVATLAARVDAHLQKMGCTP